MARPLPNTINGLSDLNNFENTIRDKFDISGFCGKSREGFNRCDLIELLKIVVARVFLIARVRDDDHGPRVNGGVGKTSEAMDAVVLEMLRTIPCRLVRYPNVGPAYPYD
ncbi:unnamed protein product [Ilex paraguariensis]|uniref:Uncharacterized protein n=1 Tax=Ilex paraguariensis TaxID=185542 RepID=A0ABC8TK49_9AQUA